MTAYAEVWLDWMPPACLTPSHPSNEGGPGDSLEGTCLGTCLLSSHHEDTHTGKVMAYICFLRLKT